MKLYNKTRYPDNLLESLLVQAGKAVGARTANVIVVVNCAKPGYHHIYGTAYRCDYVKRWALEARRYTKDGTRLKQGIVETDGGYFTLTIPYPFVPKWIKESDIYPAWSEAHCFDGLSIAEGIFKTATHEWQHIIQYQQRKFNFRDRRERAKHHDNRAWERDAIKASSRANGKPRDKAQEAMLNLALWIEDNK